MVIYRTVAWLLVPNKCRCACDMRRSMRVTFSTTLRY